MYVCAVCKCSVHGCVRMGVVRVYASLCACVFARAYACVCAYVRMRMRVYAGTSISVCAMCVGGGNAEAQLAAQQVTATDMQDCLQGRRGWGAGPRPPCAHHLPSSAAPSPPALGFWAQVPPPRPRTWLSSAAEAWQPGRESQSLGHPLPQPPAPSCETSGRSGGSSLGLHFPVCKMGTTRAPPAQGGRED